MLDQLVKDYAAYFKVDLKSGFQSVQDVIDNMLTRLEELTSVIQMIKLKNSDCSYAVSNDISKYRAEITMLSKKVFTVNKVIEKLHSNMEALEKSVEKAEADFGVQNDSKIKNLFKPFLKKSREPMSANDLTTIASLEHNEFKSVLEYFEPTNRS